MMHIHELWLSVSSFLDVNDAINLFTTNNKFLKLKDGYFRRFNPTEIKLSEKEFEVEYKRLNKVKETIARVFDLEPLIDSLFDDKKDIDVIELLHDQPAVWWNDELDYSTFHLSYEFIDEFQDKMNWDLISKYQKMDVSFIEKYQDKINWIELSYTRHLKLSILYKFAPKLRWNLLVQPNEDGIVYNFTADMVLHFGRFLTRDKAWVNTFTYSRISEHVILECIKKGWLTSKVLPSIFRYQRVSSRFRQLYPG
jgi:hypothetical protein